MSAVSLFAHFKRSGQTGAGRLLYAMIEVKNLRMQFGGIRAVDDVSLTLETGRITGLIGPNGAGKTTLFNVIAGHYKPTSGQVLLDGEANPLDLPF